MLGLLLFAVLFGITLRRLDATHVDVRVARAATIALTVPVVLLWAFATIGVTMPSWGGALVVAGTAAVLLAWRRPVSRAGAPTNPTILVAGSIALIAFVTQQVDSTSIFIDPLGHLAWSRDLVDTRNWYPVGFPALVSAVSVQDPLGSTLRVLPWMLHFGIALQFIALGSSLGSRGAGIVGALAYLVAPTNFNRLNPTVPEAFAVLLIVATWTEVIRGTTGRSGARLFYLVFATFMVHVSVLEAIHLGAIILMLVVAPQAQPLGVRLRHILASALGAILAISTSPFIMSVFGDSPPLLLREQPGEIDPLDIPGLAWSWGYGTSLALAVFTVWWVARFRRFDRRISLVALLFLGCGFIFVVPVLLATVDIQLGIQLFNSRLYGWASIFLSMLITVLLATLAPRDPRVLVPTVLLIGGIEIVLEPTDFVAIAFGLVVLMMIARLTGPFPGWLSQRRPLLATVVLLIVASGIGVRAATWWPNDPEWIRALGSDSSADFVLSNWPALNWIDARTNLSVRDGLAGRDAKLALHRLRQLPELRRTLWWCTDTEAGQILEDWLLKSDAGVVDIVIHPSFARAWSGYAVAKRLASVDTGGPGYRMFEGASCDMSAHERLKIIRTTIGSMGGVQSIFDKGGVTVFRWRRDGARNVQE